MLSLRNTVFDSGMAEHVSIAEEQQQPLRVGDELHPVRLLAVERSFGAIFGLVPLAGDLGAALGRPDGLALSSETAQRLFGTHTPQEALGQTVRIGDEVLQVMAVLPDVPINATLRWDALSGPLSRARAPDARLERPLENRRGGIVVKLRPGQDAARLVALMQAAIDASPMEQSMRSGATWRADGRPGIEVGMVALPDAYFDPDLASGREAGNYGQRSSVLALAAVALLILALAISNWVNLATVRTLRRQREIGMRKVLGAGALRVAGQFVAESVLVALAATLAGIVLAWLLLPLFAILVERQLDSFFTPARLALGLAAGLLAGVAGGLYPAWSALRVRPSTVLAGRDSSSETVGNLWLRRALTVLQFASAMALSAVTIAVGWQAWYAGHADPGFNPEQLTLFHMPVATPEQVRAFTAAVARLPQVDGAAVSAEAVGRDQNKIISAYQTRTGDVLRIEIKRVSPNFFDVYRVRPLAGRLFNDKRDQPDANVALLNRAALTLLGYRRAQDVVGQVPLFTRSGRDGVQIVGVAPDLRQQSMRERSGPIMYVPSNGDSVVTLRSSLDQETLRTRVAPLWKRYFPHGIMLMQSAASVYTERYATDARMAQMLGAAGLVALALSAFGIYVLSAYTVQRGRREIVMRKLYGAGNGAIALRLGREFGLTLGVAALLGLPLAALAIRHYLSGFTERAPFGPWPLVAGVVLALLAALLATARNTALAIRMSPTQMLRD